MLSCGLTSASSNTTVMTSVGIHSTSFVITKIVLFLFVIFSINLFADVFFFYCKDIFRQISTDQQTKLQTSRFRVGQNLYQGAVLRDSHSPVTSQDWPAALASWYSEVELFKQDPTKGRVHLILLRNLMD